MSNSRQVPGGRRGRSLVVLCSVMVQHPIAHDTFLPGYPWPPHRPVRVPPLNLRRPAPCSCQAHWCLIQRGTIFWNRFGRCLYSTDTWAHICVRVCRHVVWVGAGARPATAVGRRCPADEIVFETSETFHVSYIFRLSLCVRARVCACVCVRARVCGCVCVCV